MLAFPDITSLFARREASNKASFRKHVFRWETSQQNQGSPTKIFPFRDEKNAERLLEVRTP